MNYKLFEDLKAELIGWNVESVAAEAKVAEATIWYWLAGKTKTPRIDTLTKVAKTIGFELTLVRKTVQLKLVSSKVI